MTYISTYRPGQPAISNADKLHSKITEHGKLGFSIRLLEDCDKSVPLSMQQPRRLDCFEVIWIKNGAGKLMLDLEIFDVRGNILYWLSPGQLHQFTRTEPIEGYQISFCASFAQMNGGQTTLPFAHFSPEDKPGTRIIQIGQHVQAEIEEVVKTMVREYSNHFQYRSEILKGLLKMFIAYVSQKFEAAVYTNSAGCDHELFSRFMRSLEKNYAIKKNVADYADELAVTANYFSEVIKKVSGFTASHHIQQRIIIEAKRALVCTGGTMKEIAFQLGFNDAAHFSKFYKNVTGENFSEYRRREK